MPYLFETHMHTAPTSSCASDSPNDMIHAYHERGYHGVVVTNHFINGNVYGESGVPSDLSWRDSIDTFLVGYREALEVGTKLSMTILLGWEYATGGADLLTYGLDEEFLYANPQLANMNPREYIELIQSAGGIVSIAHPFRTSRYVTRTSLYPQVDAVEALNATHHIPRYYNPKFDQLATFYAETLGKIKTAGCDSHSTDELGAVGMLFEDEIKTNAEYIAALRSGKYKLMLNGEEYGA